MHSSLSLTRADVLHHTDNGRDVFRHYLGLEPKRGRNFQNPFAAPQQTVSFNLYPNESGEWRYKDFATSDEGSWLDFVMQLHSLTSSEALAHVVDALDLLNVHSSQLLKHRIVRQHSAKSPRPFLATYRSQLTDVELAYWQQYGIGEEVLAKYGVQAVIEYTTARADSSPYSISSTVNNPLFAYNAGQGFVKIYAPKASKKAYKFTWPTGQPNGYVFGRSQLGVYHPVILLAAGEKDAMALSAHGYAAVTVGSENALIPAVLIAELQNLCDEVIICYDADETGRVRSKELGKEHGLRRVEWPASLAPYGKDAADFYQAVYRKQLSPQLLTDAINQAPFPTTQESPDTSTDPSLAALALPMYPQAVYDNLPDFLRRACAPFKGHEKAVMLLSSVGVLSGCFPEAGGRYHQRRVGLNLFTFVSAPAASGKGTLTWAQQLARPAHKKLLNESKAQRSEYEAQVRAHKAAGKGASSPPLPSGPPPHRMLFLPGDTTAAALMNTLNDNEGRGIICETEADTLTTAMGGEHGKFADKLCKIFQHESVPLMRKGENIYLELEHPAVSVVLSGTPAQVPRLMPNAENGLMSRFLFYCFRQPHVWRSGAPNGRAPLEPYFEDLGRELSAMIAAMPCQNETGVGRVNVTLSQADWHRLDTACAAGLHEAFASAGDAGASSAYRLGLIAFRLIGLLTVLRCFEYGEPPALQVEADPLDVTTALLMTETARAHTLHVLATLPSSAKPAQKVAQYKFEEKAAKVAKAAELQAQGMSIRTIGEQLGVSKSQVGAWLSAKDA